MKPPWTLEPPRTTLVRSIPVPRPTFFRRDSSIPAIAKRDKPDTASIAQTCIPQLSVATLILCLTFRHRPSSLGTITLLARNIHATLGAHISSLVSWRTIRDLVHPEQLFRFTPTLKTLVGGLRLGSSSASLPRSITTPRSHGRSRYRFAICFPSVKTYSGYVPISAPCPPAVGKALITS